VVPKAAVLLIDEVGHEPLTPEQAHVFFQLVNVGTRPVRSFLTSNRPFSKWPSSMSDEAVATRHAGPASSPRTGLQFEG